MPDVGQQKKLTLKSPKEKRQAAGATTPPKKKAPGVLEETKKTQSRGTIFDGIDTIGVGLGDDDTDDEDEIIQESLSGQNDSGASKYKMMFIAGGVVVGVIVVFLLFRGMFGGKPNTPPDNPAQPSQSEEPGPAVDPIGNPNVGTQDFTTNSTMQSSSALTSPDDFLKDINGLTTRVDYTVSDIQSAADFVSYTKHRGTWGGGLELYWLECTYKSAQYVVQVPFRYYKELDDEGIVPVKMEVLRIKSETSDEYLTIISHMALDEATLKSILKSQSK